MKKAYYAISGDPVTNGHLYVMEKAIDLFDELMVALAINPSKKYAFSFEKRSMMLSLSLQPFNGRVAFTSIQPHEVTVKAAFRAGARYVVRGLRNTEDFPYELKMAHFNSKVQPEVQTIWIPTPPNLADVSSSFVKSLVGLEDWEKMVAGLVPPVVLDHLREMLEEQRNTT